LTRAKAANDNENVALLRRLLLELREDGTRINRKRVQRLMRRLGIQALGPKPRTTKPAPGHRIYPVRSKN